MRVNFYGAINEANIIRTSINNIYEQNSGLSDSDMQISRLTVTTDPANVSADSDFGFSETLDLEFPFDSA